MSGSRESYRVGIQSSVGWRTGSTSQDRQENPVRVGCWVTGKFFDIQSQDPELGSDRPEPETSWVIPQDREQEAGSSGLRILPHVATDSAPSPLCQEPVRRSLGEERDLAQAQRSVKVR